MSEQHIALHVNGKAHFYGISFRKSMHILRKQRENAWLLKTGRQQREPLTPEERRVYQQLFHLLDTDGGGSLDVDELMLAMKALGTPVRRSVLQKQLNELVGKNDDLNFQDFVIFLTETGRQYVAGDHNNSSTYQPSKSAQSEKSELQNRKRTGIGTMNVQGQKDHNQSGEHALEKTLPFALYIPAYFRRQNMDLAMNMECLDTIQDEIVLPRNPSENPNNTSKTQPVTHSPEFYLQRSAKAGRPAQLLHVQRLLKKNKKHISGNVFR